MASIEAALRTNETAPRSYAAHMRARRRRALRGTLHAPATDAVFLAVSFVAWKKPAAYTRETVRVKESREGRAKGARASQNTRASPPQHDVVCLAQHAVVRPPHATEAPNTRDGEGGLLKRKKGLAMRRSLP